MERKYFWFFMFFCLTVNSLTGCGGGGGGGGVATPVDTGLTKFVFQATDGTYGKELWVTDGTSGGTTLVKNINTTGTGGIKPPGACLSRGNETWMWLCQ